MVAFSGRPLPFKPRKYFACFMCGHIFETGETATYQTIRDINVPLCDTCAPNFAETDDTDDDDISE